MCSGPMILVQVDVITERTWALVTGVKQSRIILEAGSTVLSMSDDLRV